MASENLFAMTLRFRNEASRVARQLGQELESTGKKGASMGTQLGQAIKSTRTSAHGLIGSFISLRTLIAATFAYRMIQKFGSFLTSLTEQYKESESSTTKLSLALAAQGNYVKNTTRNLLDYANKLIYLTGIDDEVIKSQMALLATYGMNAEQIRTAIMPILDLSIARHISLETATNLVGKAFVGFTATLARYGIVIDKNLSKEEKYAAVLNELNRYQGIATGMLNIYAGKTSLLGEVWKEVKESLGAIIKGAIEYTGVLDFGINKLMEWDTWLSKNSEALGILAGRSLAGVVAKLEEVYRSLRTSDLPAWITTVVEGFNIAGQAVQVFVRRLFFGINIVKNFWQLMMQELDILWFGLTDPGYLKQYINEQKQRREEFYSWITVKESIIENRAAEDIRTIGKAWDTIKTSWESTSKGDYWSRVNRQLAEINQTLRSMGENTKDNIINQEKHRDVIANTFKLTQSMAQQYALATAMEQAQINYIVRLRTTMIPESVGGLTDMQKKLISSQSLLKEQFAGIFEEYTTRRLANETSLFNRRGALVNVKIGFTKKAEELFRIEDTDTDYEDTRNMERLIQ